ncbi:MAG: S4 domain-containing protein, partial [Acidobacteriota bacterium]
MRLNKYVALATGMSRRAADDAIAEGRVTINGEQASLGQQVGTDDRVALDNSAITLDVKITTILLNKPAGYVCSRDGQGSKTVYELLPP